MKVIDVLRHQQKVACAASLEFGQCHMRCIGLDIWLLHKSSSQVVEAMDKFRVTTKAIGRGNVFDAMPFPQSIGTPKRRNPDSAEIPAPVRISMFMGVAPAMGKSMACEG